jgi:hypothetical protein
VHIGVVVEDSRKNLKEPVGPFESADGSEEEGVLSGEGDDRGAASIGIACRQIQERERRLDDVDLDTFLTPDGLRDQATWSVACDTST